MVPENPSVRRKIGLIAGETLIEISTMVSVYAVGRGATIHLVATNGC